MDPKVTLISWTQDPIKTVCDVWWASKTEMPLEKLPAPDIDLFRRIIAQRIPISEHIDFVFILENVSVSWREQAVRHRIGTHVGERLGVDFVPDLADSSWWSQSMRIQDMGHFATNGAYRVPETLEGKIIDGKSAEELYHITMHLIQIAYNGLVAAGVPMEDARDLIPLGAQHRISWKLNLSALMHIIGKRSCWILQAGLWHPIIKGMISELVERVDPVFGDLAMPPCAALDGGDWHFNGCVYREENARRMSGDDALPLCPLYVNFHTEYGGRDWWNDATSTLPMFDEIKRRAEEYRDFWRRNPYTFVVGEEVTCLKL